MTHISRLIAFTALASVIFPISAEAQFARNNNSPIDATADAIQNNDGVTTLTGQVDVRQGETRILADRMDIYSGSTGVVGAVNDITRIEATGNFYYLTPEQEVRGNKGVYEQKTDDFTVTGDVILLQGDGNVVTGDTLIYNLTTAKAKVIGSCKGRRCGSKGRVNILIKNNRSSGAS
jgi:lipopolysaccharide export system protein LptA